MDVARLGADVRLLRRRRGWTQGRLAAEAKVGRWVVVDIELGRGSRITVERLTDVVAALGGYLSVRVMYHGEGLDRLRDRRHAALVDQMVARLRNDGWEVATEVSFNVFGERGAIDILAFEPVTGTLLVIEVKTVVPDVGGMLATLDRKVRLARDLAGARGWRVRTVGRLLVLPEASTARRRIEQHEATFRNAFPARNVEVNRWFRAPAGSLSGLLFLSSAHPADTSHEVGHAAETGSLGPRMDSVPRARSEP
jgi:transcriptional regulator with XRE-family HTH domain